MTAEPEQLTLVVRVHAARHNLGYSIEPYVDGYIVRFGKQTNRRGHEASTVAVQVEPGAPYWENEISDAVETFLEGLIRDVPPAEGMKTVGPEGP